MIIELDAIVILAMFEFSGIMSGIGELLENCALIVGYYISLIEF